MTSDSDFMPLAMRIRQDGMPVYGFGTGKTPESFRQACTRFIDVGALMEAAKQPAPKDSSNPIDEELIGLLGAVIKASKKDDQGYASLNAVGQRAANRSSFDARKYGFSRVSALEIGRASCRERESQ